MGRGIGRGIAKEIEKEAVGKAREEKVIVKEIRERVKEIREMVKEIREMVKKIKETVKKIKEMVKKIGEKVTMVIVTDAEVMVMMDTEKIEEATGKGVMNMIKKERRKITEPENQQNGQKRRRMA